MRKIALSLFFAMNSCGWIFFVYFVKSNAFSVEYLLKLLGIVALIILTAWILSLFFKQKNFEKLDSALNFEINNDVFLPIYLGYFFVALSIQNLHTLLIIYVLIVFFNYLSKTNYYNPTLILFGYNYFVVTTSNNAKIYVLSKKEIKLIEKCTFNKLCRVSDYFFIDIDNEN